MDPWTGAWGQLDYGIGGSESEDEEANEVAWVDVFGAGRCSVGGECSAACSSAPLCQCGVLPRDLKAFGQLHGNSRVLLGKTFVGSVNQHVCSQTTRARYTIQSPVEGNCTMSVARYRKHHH